MAFLFGAVGEWTKSLSRWGEWVFERDPDDCVRVLAFISTIQSTSEKMYYITYSTVDLAIVVSCFI